MAELANCSRCGNLFVKEFRDICRDCYNEEEEAFRTVYSFLLKKENRKATMYEIIEKTGVDEFFISKFIRGKRLLLSQFPNLTYPCERCGAGITEGRLCANCSKELQRGLKKQQEIDAVQKKAADKEKQESEKVYYTVNKDKKKL